MSIEELKNLGRDFFETQDRLKGRLSSDICATDYTAYIAGNPPLDFEGHSQFGTLFYKGFPDLKHFIEYVITDGRKVVVRFTIVGKHTGNFLGIEPTNKFIRISAIAIMHVFNDKVKELHAEYNHMALLKQLGQIPAVMNN